MSVGEPRELEKVAEGREAEMFAWGAGAILRLLRDPAAGARNQWQAAAMEAARSRGVSVPAVHIVTTAMGRPGMVMERIEGPDLLTLIGRRPWKAFSVGRVSGEVHARLHAVTAPTALPALRPVLRERIESVTGLAEPLAEFALATLDGLPDGDTLCHGDFHPGNILMAGERPVLIDWTNAMRGDPAADVARTRLILRMGEPPPGTSAVLRALTLMGRNLMVWLYLRSYRRLRPLDMAAVARWEVPTAAARLAEGIAGEREGLLAFLERASRRQAP